MLLLLYMSSVFGLISSLSHGEGCSDHLIPLTSNSTINSSVSFQLCISESWDTVYIMDTICGDNWSLKNSLVVCKQLGYQDVWTHSKFGHEQRSSISFMCNGTESNIMDCSNKTIDHNCSSISVGCRRDQFINTSDVRLVNAYSDAEGDIEIFFEGSWMPLCYHNIGDMARVEYVCKRLGWNSGEKVPPITEGVQCVGSICDGLGCLRQFLGLDWAARIQCQRYATLIPNQEFIKMKGKRVSNSHNVNNTRNMGVSLSDDGVPMVIHEGRQTRVCVSDHVLSAGDDCENSSSLPMAICQQLEFDTADVTTRNATDSGAQLPILIGGRSNCTMCPSSLSQETFLKDFTFCLPEDVEACNTSVEFVITCRSYEDDNEHHGFSVGAIIGIIVGVLLVLLFLSPFIGSSMKSCYKNCVKSWFTSDRASTHPTGTTNPGGSKVTESKGGHSLALSMSEAESSTYDSSTLTKTQSRTGVTKDRPPSYNETLKCPKQSDSTL